MSGLPAGQRWNKARIVAALHAWTAEEGKPPLSYEWSPGTARSLGLLNDRVRKWEREWPRWPGADTLRWHFGCWSAALEEAVLPVRRLALELPLAERIEVARRLRQVGQSTAAIADHLGVHVTTVRAYLHAGRCRDCAAPVVSARRCLACALARRRAPGWSGEEILAGIRSWAGDVASRLR